MEDESGVTRSIIEELDYWDIKANQVEGGIGVNRSIIDERYTWDIEQDQI